MTAMSPSDLKGMLDELAAKALTLGVSPDLVEHVEYIQHEIDAATRDGEFYFVEVDEAEDRWMLVSELLDS